MYTKVTFSSPWTGAEYEFLIEKDLHSSKAGYCAVSAQGAKGGLCTEGDTLEELLLIMIPDCVATWEGIAVT